MTVKSEEKRLLGEKIRRLREEKNISQHKLAAKIGVYSQNIGKYERGESIPSALVLKRIAEVLGVSADSLLSDNGKEKRFVQVEDTELVKMIEQVDRMNPENKEMLMRIMNLFIRDNNIREAYS